MQRKYLITTDAWFYAPDGKQYKAVWGDVIIFDDNKVLGIKTNIRATNWYARVGTEDNHVIVAGCQIHYACKSESKPNVNLTEDYSIEAGEVKNYNRPSSIYIAE